MGTDRSLATLLRALQDGYDEQDITRLFGSATTLLSSLANPLNVTLLTSRLLSAPSIWHRPNGLHTVISVLSIFNSAAIHIAQQEESRKSSPSISRHSAIGREDWAIAVVKGADDRSPRWRHLCVIAGLLIGFEGRGLQNISTTLRRKLESATVTAANTALEDGETRDELAANSVAVILSHVFSLLHAPAKLRMNHDLLLPILYHALLHSKEGLNSGYFLSIIDADIRQSGDMKFAWSTGSSTYVQCQRMTHGPLVSCFGSLSRLAAFSVENVQNVDLIFATVKEMAAFTKSFCIQWRQNKLSEIDITEEAMFLNAETLRESLPSLWGVLKSTMFATVIILKSVLGRMLRDVRMPVASAPFVAIQTLHILQDLYFISSRPGVNAFSQYMFVYLTAIDILSHYPLQAEAFLRDIHPTSIGRIPQHPLDRCHDLYFLNTAEHFTSVLTIELNEELLLGVVNPYLGLGSDPKLLEIFEAAHSVMLAVLSTPSNSSVLAKHLRSYLGALFNVFPQSVSPRQFRLAIKTLIRITSPPFAISDSQPLLPSIILEMVLLRLESASPALLPQVNAGNPGVQDAQEQQWSEQSVLLVTMFDALPFLPIEQLQDWLPIVTECLKFVAGESQQLMCRQRLWEVLSSGEMDVDRSTIAISWWSTGGGKELLARDPGDEKEGAFMSGGLQEISRL